MCLAPNRLRKQAMRFFLQCLLIMLSAVSAFCCSYTGAVSLGLWRSESRANLQLHGAEQAGPGLLPQHRLS